MSAAAAAFLIVAFLFGSIPTGYILGRSLGVDLRKTGSGNIGATNAARVLGKKYGAVTLILDLLKGALAAQLPALAVAAGLLAADSAPALAPACGAAAVFGHCFSPFLKFNGGKGVAAALGAFLALAPLPALAALLIFLLVYKGCGYVSAGSISAALVLPAAIYFEPLIRNTVSGPDSRWIAAAIVGALVIVRHKQNILRLINGTELRAKKSGAVV